MALAIGGISLAATASSTRDPVLSIAGGRFQIDGRDTFVLGVSLFDALGSSPPRDADLDALRAWGVKLVRVWAHWNEPIYQSDGALTPVGRGRLTALVDRLAARQLLLELVLLRPGQLPGQRYAVFASESARVRAVESITTALRQRRHVIFDLYNEHDHPDGPISHAAARRLRDAVKAADPGRLVTISSTDAHLVGTDAARNLSEEIGTGPHAVAVDLVAPHFPRTDDWAIATGERVRALQAATGGRTLPIYLNEENRAEPKEIIPADVFRTAYMEAVKSGAAGWVFHTAAGFSLGARPFIDALGAEERKGLERIGR
jgi:hypothetical protein